MDLEVYVTCALQISMCMWLSWEAALIKMQILISRSGIGLGILHLWQAFRWHWCCWSKDHTLNSEGVASFLLAQFCGCEENQLIWIIWWEEQSKESLNSLWTKELGSYCCFSLVQFSSVAQSCPTLCDPVNRSTLGLPVHHQLPSLPKLTSIEPVMPSSHLILCCPLLLLPPIPPSIRVFSNESTLGMRWSKYWNFSFSISPSNEHPGLISFRMNWLDPLAVQGTLSQESSPTPQFKAST